MAVAIFDRIRRIRSTGQTSKTTTPLTPVAGHLLPDINQRVTVAVDDHAPVPSRVEDVDRGMIQLAYPTLELELGDSVLVSWERDDVWFTLETRVLGLDASADVPTLQVEAGGRLSRYDEQRTDVRRAIELTIELRVLKARAIRAGRELHTTTIEVGSGEVSFQTTAPFAPGDLVEARMQLGEDASDAISARIRVTRVDTAAGTWRNTCIAAIDEILRSDRARLVAVADALGAPVNPAHVETQPAPVIASIPTTLDGVGGRDQPQDLANVEQVVEWLRRRG